MRGSRNFRTSIAPALRLAAMSEVEDATAALAAADITSVLPPAAAGEQVVTPWDVAGGSDGKIDYAKLVGQADSPQPPLLQRSSNPRVLSDMASYDMASNMCQDRCTPRHRHALCTVGS